MHSLGLGGLDFTPSHTLDEHRPQGFKTADIVAPFTADYSESDPEQNKVTVSFNSIVDDHIRSTKNDVTTTASPERNRRAEAHYQHQQQEPGIIGSSDRIRKFNELPEEVNDANETNTANGHEDDVSSSETGEDDNVSNDKWHNEIWQETIFKEIHDPLHRHPRRDGKH